MRLNDTGIDHIVDAIKSKWGYLRIADSTTNTYDGNEYDAPLQTLVLESTSVTGNELTLIYRLGVLDLNGEDIDMSGLAVASAGNVVHSNEVFNAFTKDDLTQWRWVYKVKVIR